jgi:hypothetical protein
MNINLEKKENKIILKVALKFRGKRGETKNFTNAAAKNCITQNNPEIKLGNIVSAPSKPINNVDSGLLSYKKKNLLTSQRNLL